ncbi:unknown [Bacteroides sp. CAG:754]|nr:unknown [Bacteroides sp. CAG:754]
MDGSEQEVVRTHQLRQFHSFRKILAGFFEEFVDVLIDFGRIGTRRLKYHTGNTRMPVRTTMISITILSQLYIGNIFQFQHFAVIRRTNDNVPEFFRSNQTPFILHRILIGFVGVLAKRTCCRFYILFGKHHSNVRRNQLVLRHHIGLHPYTHTIFTAQNHQVTHTADTENLRFHIDAQIVGQEVFIITIVRTGKREHLKDTGLTLGSGHTDLRYFCRELSRST